MEPSALEEFAARVRGLRGQPVLELAALELANAFEAGGVDYLLLKGPALVRLLYTPGEHRGYTDVDLLIAPQHLPAARDVLAGLGYTNYSARRGIEDVAGVVHAEVWARANEDVGPLMIDLHHQLAGTGAAAEVTWRALIARRTWIELRGGRAAVLGPAGLALHLALHAAQHGHGAVMAFGDLRRGVARLPTDVWRDAASLAHEVGAATTFAAGLRLIPSGAALARELGLAPSEHAEWDIEHREVRPRGTFHVQAFAEGAGLAARAAVVRRALLPTREWIIHEHPWAARHRARVVVARALHLLRAPAWAAAAWRFRRRARRSSGA
ncbi:MAG: hypothetical protein QOE31_336 [Solirubrobacteraceae bacterium]|nr:hypothetical protein [Solirubrobacteraceae bacterium]